MLILTERLREELSRQGEMFYPHECCGILLGEWSEEVRLVYKLVPVDNEALEKRRHFYISPDALLGAERFGMECGMEVVGFYHSHPDAPAIPSDEDMENALPECSYLILSVIRRQMVDLCSYVLEPVRRGSHSDAAVPGRFSEPGLTLPVAQEPAGREPHRGAAASRQFPGDGVEFRWERILGGRDSLQESDIRENKTSVIK